LKSALKFQMPDRSLTSRVSDSRGNSMVGVVLSVDDC
jgi:hypothetical protein